MSDLVLTESVMIHMLADLDQIVTEHDIDPTQFTDGQWWLKLRRAVDGEDYKTKKCTCDESACHWCDIHGETPQAESLREEYEELNYTGLDRSFDNHVGMGE